MSGNADTDRSELPWGWLRDKLSPCLRIKAAASPSFGERRVESQEPTPSTPKFTWKRAKVARGAEAARALTLAVSSWGLCVCFTANFFFLTCCRELLGWEMLLAGSEVGTELTVVCAGEGRAFSSFSGPWGTGGFFPSTFQVGIREETRRRAAGSAVPTSCACSPGCVPHPCWVCELRLREAKPSCSVPDHRLSPNEFSALDGKMDEESMSSSPWYFGAIHHPDPYSAVQPGSL